MIAWLAGGALGATDPTVSRYYDGCPAGVPADVDELRDARDLDALQALLLGEPWGDDAQVGALWQRYGADLARAWSIEWIDAAVDEAWTSGACASEPFWQAVPRLLADGEVDLGDEPHPPPRPPRHDDPVAVERSPWSVSARLAAGPGTGGGADGTWGPRGWLDLRVGRGAAWVGASAESGVADRLAVAQVGVDFADRQAVHSLWVGLGTTGSPHVGADVMLAASRRGQVAACASLRSGLGSERVPWTLAGGLSLVVAARP